MGRERAPAALCVLVLLLFLPHSASTGGPPGPLGALTLPGEQQAQPDVGPKPDGPGADGAGPDGAGSDGPAGWPQQQRVINRPPIDIPDLESGPKIADLGPASLVTATMVAEDMDGRIYTATNGVSPVVVGAYDPASRQITTTYRLPTGTGVWGMTHIGTDLYVGVYGPGHLYRIDTERGSVRKVAEMGSWIWSLTASPDGTIFAGTYPKGEIYSYDPSTGRTKNLGPAAPGEQYVRSIAASDTTIYAGVGTNAHLVAVDRASGRKTELLPKRYADSTFVNALSLSPDGRTLAAALTPTGPVLLFDRTPGATAEPAEIDIGSGFASAIEIGGDGDVYIGARPSGTLHRYDRDTGRLHELGTPFDGATFYRIFPGADAVRAIVESGIAEYDRRRGRFTTVDPSEVGLPPQPELAMAIAATGDLVLVSGKYGVQVHDLSSGNTWRFRIPGEAKAITPVPGEPADEVYLNVYTQARVLRMNPATGALVPQYTTGHEQTRPTDAVYAPESDVLLVGTEPDYGRRNGALSVHDLASGDVSTYRGVIPEQTVRSVAADAGGVAYLGGSTRNGLGTQPTAETASLTAFSLRTRSVLWRAEPVPGAEAITDLAVFHGRLYGVTGDGTLFEFDPERRAVLSTTRPGTDRGSLVIAGGRLYGTDGNRLYRIDPRPSGAPRISTVADGLHAQWYGASPLLAADPDGNVLYTLQDRNLVRVRLDVP